eukprot:233336_1
MTVKCGDNGCNSIDIYCPNTPNSVCNIFCEYNRACFMASIYGEKGTIINVTCNGELSCYLTTLYVYETLQTLLSCNNKTSCNTLKLYGSDANNINIECNNDCSGCSGGGHDSPCEKIYIYGERVQNKINWLCNGYFACYYPYLLAHNANIVSIYGVASYSIYKGFIYAENATEFSFSCDSLNNNIGCPSTALYIPSGENTRINCIGYGCRNLQFYTKTTIKDISISFNGCNACNSVYDCIYSWDLYCGSLYNYSSQFWGLERCYPTNCDCDTLLQLTQNAWFKSYEITPKTDICYEEDNVGFCADDNKDCVYTCDTFNNCADKVINGVMAPSLTVYCSESNSCQNTRIYCPTKEGQSSCNIHCIVHESCNGANIYSNTDNVLNIKCLADLSCSTLRVYAQIANDVNLFCLYMRSCYRTMLYVLNASNVDIICQWQAVVNYVFNSYDYAPCSRLLIYGNYVKKEINILCDGKYSCYNPTIYAENANKIVIVINEKDSLADAIVYAQDGSYYIEWATSSLPTSYPTFPIYSIDTTTSAIPIETQSTSSNMTIHHEMVGIVVAGILILIGIIICLTYVAKRKKSASNKIKQQQVQVQLQQIPDNEQEETTMNNILDDNDFDKGQNDSKIVNTKLASYVRLDHLDANYVK